MAEDDLTRPRVPYEEPATEIAGRHEVLPERYQAPNAGHILAKSQMETAGSGSEDARALVTTGGYDELVAREKDDAPDRLARVVAFELDGGAYMLLGECLAAVADREYDTNCKTSRVSGFRNSLSHCTTSSTSDF